MTTREAWLISVMSIMCIFFFWLGAKTVQLQSISYYKLAEQNITANNPGYNKFLADRKAEVYKQKLYNELKIVK